MKICIGTAQLGMKYGLASNFSKMEFNEFSKIISAAYKEKIKFIDTACNYGNSEKLIGKKIINKKYKDSFKVITKIDNLRSVSSNLIYKHIENKILNSLKNLKVKKLYAILLHDIRDMESKKIDEIFKSLEKIKKKGLVKKIGFSAYYTKDVRKYIGKFNFDIIQFPFNVFDQRILNKDIQEFIKLKKIEVHIRSIFLQGILLLPKNKIPKKLYLKNPVIEKWIKVLDNKRLDPVDACLNFILKYKFYSRVVIGFDDYSQFKQVTKKYLDNKKMKTHINFRKFKVNNNLINPSKW